MTKTKDIIQRTKLVHGDKYDYSKVEYINNKTKVIIICPEHSEFEQTPNNHLNGKGCSKCVGRGFNYLPFEEAKNFVRNLNLKSQKEWNKYCISGNKPNNIPSSPINTYKDEWINMGDWLGTFTVATYNMKFLPFEDARTFVHNLNLKSRKAWNNYCKSGNKPNNIPSNPHNIYKDGWVSYGDWLGTFTVATYDMNFLSFEEARNFVRNLNLKSQIEYRKYCKSGNKPNNIPSNPHNTYKDGWVSYGDWLGTLSVHTKEFLPFEEARKYVHTLNINTSKEWFIVDKPNNIPTHPRMIYKNEWINMGDWLGTFTIASKNMIFLPFEEARNFVRNLNLKSQREWSEYCISGNKPNNIPSSPINTYKDEWINMGDWLGTFVVASKNIHENCLSYDEAKIFIKKIGVKSVNEYFNWWDENKPDFLPKHPDTYYKNFYKNMKTEKQKGPWISWYDFLGTTLKSEDKLKIIEAMADMNMTHFDCLYIYRQMYGLSSDDKREIIKKYKKETSIKRRFQRILNQNNNSKRLRINNDEFFKKIEDAEIIQFIYQHYIDTLWYDVINKKIDITEDIINIEPVGDWNTKIRTDFLFEYEFANNYKPVNGLSYKIINENTKEEEFIKLNLMQKLIIVRSVKYLCYGNFSEPGTGKTIGDICLSREINAKITVIFAINSTIKKVWEDTINRSYLDSNVIIIDKFASIDLKLSQIDESKHNYILINYEKLQIKEYSIELLDKILKLKIDKITFDETQNLKEVDESEKKIRRRNAEYFVNNVRKNNQNVQISVLTATPIVNNLFEPKSILKLLTGKKYDEINSHKSLDNLLNIHALIMSVGIRFILPINMEYKEKILNINGNSIYNKIFTDDENGIIKYKNKNYVNDYKLMLPLKLNAILPYLKKGVIIYSHFVEGFIDETREFLQKHGYSVAVFTGEEKPSEGNGGLDDFMSGKCDILVTSDPITTGMDGLQFVADTLIPITLPWTHAMWHQLIHRIYRQRSKFKVANVIIPCVEINIKDKIWCFDKDVVLRKINYKKQLSEYSLDSEIYEQIDTKKEDYSINRSDFLNFLNKQKHSIEVVRENVDDVIIPDEKLSIDSIVQKELQLAMVSYSETYSNHVKENIKNWILYHENRKTKWKVNPTEELAKIIKQNITNDHIIVDAGCGLKAEFADLFPNNKVYSYDLSNAGDNRIIVQDISHLPLHNDKSVDIVIQSQAWECLNFNDYVKEAYRILKDDGRLYIVQSKKDWDKSKVKFENAVINNNFKVENIKVKNKKNYITLSKFK